MPEKTYRFKTIRLRKLRFTGKGTKAEYNYAEDQDVAIVIPVLGNGNILFDHVYRRPIKNGYMRYRKAAETAVRQ